MVYQKYFSWVLNYQEFFFNGNITIYIIKKLKDYKLNEKSYILTKEFELLKVQC